MNFLHALFGYARRRTKKENFLLVQPSVPGRAVSEVLVAAYDFNHVFIFKQSGSPVIFDDVYNRLLVGADQKWRSSDGSSASLN